MPGENAEPLGNSGGQIIFFSAAKGSANIIRHRRILIPAM
jgi:hypothetical protein